MEVSRAQRQAIKAAHDRGRPPAAVTGVPGALLALQRTIGNARVVQALGVRRLQRVFADDVRTLLGTAPYQADADAVAALAGLQPPAGPPRAFTRDDALRWLEGTPTAQEWNDPALASFNALGFKPALWQPLKDLSNRDALQELQALATQQLVDLNTLLQNGANAGAAWNTKFTTMRNALTASLVSINAMNYANSLGAVAANKQDAYRRRFGTQVEAKLAQLRANELEIRLGGRLKFSQKRANAKFSDAATVNNAATSALVASRPVSAVAADLVAGTLRPDQIPVQVFIHNGDVVAINNRGLAALSLAGMRPVNIIFVPQAPTAIQNRIGESDTFHGAGTITSPDFRMALTDTDQETDKNAVEVPVTV